MLIDACGATAALAVRAELGSPYSETTFGVRDTRCPTAMLARLAEGGTLVDATELVVDARAIAAILTVRTGRDGRVRYRTAGVVADAVGATALLARRAARTATASRDAICPANLQAFGTGADAWRFAGLGQRAGRSRAAATLAKAAAV